MSYSPPIGIPDPGFGIDTDPPTPPSPWTTDVPGFYYVNSGTGTDTARTYGNPTAPRRTIPRPVPAGGYVEVHGTYDVVSAGQCWIQGAGTLGSPVWVVGVDQATRPTFSKKTLVYGTYTNVQYILFLQVCQVGSVASGFPVDHVVVRHCESTGTGAETNTRNGFTSQGSLANPAQYVVFYDDVAHDMGDITSTADLDCLAFTTADHLTNAWVLDCEWYNMVGGTRAGSAAVNTDSSLQRYLYWGRNHGHDGKQNALAVKYAKDVVFSQNTLERITDNSAGLSPGKGIAAQYGPDGLWMIFNRITDCRRGISIGSGDQFGGANPFVPVGGWNIYIIGNVISGSGIPGENTNGSAFGNGAVCWRSGGPYNKYLVGNTFSNNVQGLASSGADINYIENNILGPLTDSTGVHITLETPSTSVVRNDLFWDPANGTKIKWGSTTYTSLAAFQAATSKGQNSVQGDPKLAADFFTLASDSPAIGAGLADTNLTLDLYSLFQSTFGLDVRKDFIGTTRPQSTTWDMGAFEYGGSAPTQKIIFLSGDMIFGNVIVGETATSTLIVANIGDATLTVTSVSYPTGFTGATGGFSVVAGASHDIVVTFTPVATTDYSGNITVASDKTSGTNTIACSGTGVTGAAPEYPRYKRAAVLSRRRPD